MLEKNEVIKAFYIHQKIEELQDKIRTLKSERDQVNGGRKIQFTKQIKPLEEQLESIEKPDIPKPVEPEKVIIEILNEFKINFNKYESMKKEIQEALDKDNLSYKLPWLIEEVLRVDKTYHLRKRIMNIVNEKEGTPADKLKEYYDLVDYTKERFTKDLIQSGRDSSGSHDGQRLNDKAENYMKSDFIDDFCKWNFSIHLRKGFEVWLILNEEGLV